MRFFVNCLQFFNGIMGINLGGCKTAMSQQFLDCIEIRAIIHQVSGEGMPEHMRAFFIQAAGLLPNIGSPINMHIWGIISFLFQ